MTPPIGADPLWTWSSGIDDAERVTEPQPVLIVRSLGIGTILGVLAGAWVAGVCKLLAPSYDSGAVTLSVGFVVVAAATVASILRREWRAPAG